MVINKIVSMPAVPDFWTILCKAVAEHHGVSCDSDIVITHLATDGHISCMKVKQWKSGTARPEQRELERFAALYIYNRYTIQKLVEISKGYLPGTTLPQAPYFYGAVDYSLKDNDVCLGAVRIFCVRYEIPSGLACMDLIKYLITRQPRTIEEGLGMLFLAYPQYCSHS